MISDDPKALYPEVIDVVSAFPPQPYVAHYRLLFDWLTKQAGKRYWLERSGQPANTCQNSLACSRREVRSPEPRRPGYSGLDDESSVFPARRIVLLRPADSRGPLGDRVRRPADLRRRHANPATVRSVSPATELRRVLELPAGTYSERPVPARPQSVPEVPLDIRYEDLVREPPVQILGGVIGEFLELPDGGDWIEQAARLARGVQSSTFASLPAEAQEAIARGCSLGNVLLSRESSTVTTAPTGQLIREPSAVRHYAAPRPSARD